MGPFGLCITLITVILVISRMLKLMEMIINKGVPASVFLLFMLFLLPSLLVLSIPMAVLISTLMTFSRMSADNEIVAMKAGGLSLLKLLRPALIFGVACWLVSSSIMLFILPYANRPAKEKIYEMAAKHADAVIEPRVFCDDFKEFVIYVDEKLPDRHLMKGVFVSHMADDYSQRVMAASRGMLVTDEATGQTFLRLENGSVHELPNSRAERYTVSSFERQNYPIGEQAKQKLKKNVPKSHREMTVLELNRQIAEHREKMLASKRAFEEGKKKFDAGEMKEKALEGIESGYHYAEWLYNSSRVEFHKKFSLPFACVIFALMAVPLGIFSHRRKQGGSIGLSLVLFLVYYVLLSTGENLGDDGHLHPVLCTWLPNIVLSSLAAVLLYYSARERRPKLWVRLSDVVYVLTQKGRALLVRLGMVTQFVVPSAKQGGRKFAGYWTGTGKARFPRLLDRYVATRFLKLLWVVVSGLVMVFCIVQFFEVLDDVIEHESGLMPAFKYVLLSLPQLFFWVVPMAILVTAMMTINLMSRSNELTVLIAGGTSLQRIAVPIMLLALLASGLSFVLNEYVIPSANKEAERVKHEEINKRKKKSKFAKYKIWYKGAGNRIYNIGYIDQKPEDTRIKGITIFEFDENLRISQILRAEDAFYANGRWYFENVDFKQMTAEGPRSQMMERVILKLEETPADFVKSRPNPDEMSYVQLRRYIDELKGAGYSYQQYQTDLMNKIALPTIALIIALIAVPLGAMAGKSRKLVGLGAAVAIAGVFFVIHSSFVSLGHSGRIPHILAAWAANVMFGVGGFFLFTHAKT